MEQEQRITEPCQGETPAPSAPARRLRGGAPASETGPACHGRAKGGAPALNVNAQSHGVWSFLALGRLPKGASYVRRLMGELRRKLEADVAAAHRQVSLTHAALVTTICRHEGRALLLSRYLALEGDGLKLIERMAVLEAIGRATDARDKAIKQLDLDRESTGWNPADFYRQPPPTLPARDTREVVGNADTLVASPADASNAAVGVSSTSNQTFA